VEDGLVTDAEDTVLATATERMIGTSIKASARNATTSCKKSMQPNGKQSLELRKGCEEERILTIAVMRKESGGSSYVPISSGGIAVSDKRTDGMEHRAVFRSDRAFKTIATGSDRGRLKQIAQTELQSDQVGRSKNLVYVRYLDHVLFKYSSPFRYGPVEREAVGWLVKEDGEAVWIVADRGNVSSNQLDSDCGLIILISDILEMRGLERGQRLNTCCASTGHRRVCASERESEKLDPT